MPLLALDPGAERDATGLGCEVAVLVWPLVCSLLLFCLDVLLGSLRSISWRCQPLRGPQTAGQERTGMKFCVILSRGSLGFSGLWRSKKKQKQKTQQLCGDQPSSSIRSAADGVIALQIAQCIPSIIPHQTRLFAFLTTSRHSHHLLIMSSQIPGPDPFPPRR
ncbi:hypothetical protein BJX62DRAFT_144657 [Aspergillus germanicus]